MDKQLTDFLMYGIPGGIGIAIGVYLPPEKRTEKILALLGGISLFGYGAYKAYKGVTPPIPPKNFPIVVTSPQPDESWSCLQFQFAVAEIENTYNTPEKVWAGLTLINGKGDIFDKPAIEMDMQPKRKYRAIWGIELGCLEGENWKARFSVWDVEPKPGVEEKHRVGDSGWINFKVVWL